MGADDANEGHGPGDCVEHVWRLRGVTFASDGAHADFECIRCEGLRFEQPGAGVTPRPSTGQRPGP